MGRGLTAYLCVIEAQLHIGDSHGLKEKRKVVRSIKDQLRGRFGATVAEIEGHDTWQSTTLLCAIVGGPDTDARADHVQRFIESRVPEGCSFRRTLRTLDDLGL